MEVVLDLADVGVAQFVGEAAEMHRLAEVAIGGLLVWTHARKEIQSELAKLRK